MFRTVYDLSRIGDSVWFEHAFVSWRCRLTRIQQSSDNKHIVTFDCGLSKEQQVLQDKLTYSVSLTRQLIRDEPTRAG